MKLTLNWQQQHKHWLAKRNFDYVISGLIETLKTRQCEAYWQEVRDMNASALHRIWFDLHQELTEAFMLEIEDGLRQFHIEHPEINIERN